MREISGELNGGSKSPRDFGDPTFEELMRRAGDVRGGHRGEPRGELLVDTVATLASVTSMDELLPLVVEAAARLTGARAAALVLSGSGPAGRSQVLASHDVRAVTLPPSPSQAPLPASSSARPSPAALPFEVPLPRGAGPDVLTAPVRHAGREQCVLQVTGSLDPRGFDESDTRLLEALAAAAGMAVANARLLQDSAQRQQWCRAAADLAASILNADSEAAVPRVLAERAREVAQADLVWVATRLGTADVRLRAVAGTQVDPEAHLQLDVSWCLERPVGDPTRSLVVHDVTDDPRCTELVTSLGLEAPARAMLAPLRLSDGLTGAVCLVWVDDPGPTALLQDDELAAILLDHTTATLRVADSRRDLQRLAVAEERDRIARDLHDVVIQHLYAISLELQSAALAPDLDAARHQLDGTVDAIEETIRDIRRSIFALGSAHDSTDPRTTLHEVVDRAARTMKLRPTLRLRGPVRALVSADLLDDVLAVVTETLANTARHAEAKLCAVEVSVVDGITVRVTDDGKGMSGVQVESGLANLRRRAELRGGSLEVVSALNHGTSVKWWVPLGRASGDPATT